MPNIIPSSIALVKKLNELVRQANPESALNGLEEVTKGLRILAICYANPNPNNPNGMTDDPMTLITHLVRILETPTDEASSDTMPKL